MSQNEMMKTTIHLFAAFVAILLLSSQARAHEFDGLILDGRPVSSSSAVSKAMVLVQVRGGTCSGVVLNSTHVLTAGHCVLGHPSVSEIKVSLGAAKKPGPAVRSYRIHPSYGWEGGYVRADLAVLRMAAPFGRDVVAAPITASELPEGLPLLTAGFGYSDRRRTKIGRLLQEDFVFGKTAEYKPGSFSDGSRLLMLNGSNNLCQGDSGGATFRQTSAGLRTVGIHSMADCDSRGYDALVLDYRSWIQSAISGR